MDKKYERGGSMFSQVHPLANEGHNETFTGYSLSTSRIGSATSPFTEMQITEVEAKLREGMRIVEAGTLEAKKFETIPVEHFRDMRRLAKLANAEITMHAPLVDPAGFVGDKWHGEEGREDAERQFKNVIMKSLEANPQGNIPIVIHAAGDGSTPANIWERGPKGEFLQKTIFVVNQLNGSLEQIEKEKVYNPRTGKPEEETPMERLKDKNIKNWREMLQQVQEPMAKRDELSMELHFAKEIEEKVRRIENGNAANEELSYEERRIRDNAWENARRARIYNELLSDNVEAIAKISVKFGGSEGKKVAEKISEIYSKNEVDPHGEALRYLVEKEKEGFRPTLLRPVDEFSREHVAETFSNLAVWAKDYAEKRGYKAPIIVAENFFPHTSFSTAESMTKLMEESRNKTESLLIKKGMNAEDAKNEAKKLIGVTWDVGHINNFKKYGFKDEDVINETDKIAKYVKHLHMHDNLGIEPSHLPVGMGNVPLKKILNVLREEGYDGRAILEGGAAASFKTSDFKYSLQNLDTPIYGMMNAAPAQSYFSGYGNMLPEQHFSMYGGGFSQLPAELGGRSGGKGSRFTGTPTE